MVARGLSLALLALCAACTYGRPVGLPLIRTGDPPKRELRERRDPATGHLIERTELLVWPDGETELHGKQELWYPDGMRRSVKQFHHGSEAGESFQWHPDGSPLATFTPDPSGSTLVRFRHANGEVQAEGRARDGRREGEWSFWHDNGQLAKRGAYVRGRREGVWTQWHPNGGLAARGRYVDDQRVSPWRHWEAEPPVVEERPGDQAAEPPTSLPPR